MGFNFFDKNKIYGTVLFFFFLHQKIEKFKKVEKVMKKF
jgi:putative effector of murein hydrolase LrgA (UPF0299 family)